MKAIHKFLALLVTAASLTNLASAGIVTTTFAGGNGFAGNMFDVQIGASALKITGIDVNLDGAGNSNAISVYTRTGTYAGNTSTPTGWTLQDTVTVTSAGTNLATHVDLSDFVLGASGLFGFYVTISDYDGVSDLRYTNGSNVFSNADLTITTGIGKGNPDFSGADFNPRTWNGSIYYDLDSGQVPEPASLALVGIALAGLAVSRRRMK